MVYYKLREIERKGSNSEIGRVVLLNPPMVSRAGDITGTGTPYWPIPLAIIAAMLDGVYNVKICDMFGRNPTKKTADGELVLHGVPLDIAKASIRENDIVVLYSGHAIAHSSVLKLIGFIGAAKPLKIIVIENSNFVNAYPLDYFYDDFKKAGATIIAGDPYDVIIKAIDGEYDTKERHQCKDIASLPIPKWDGFPLDSYWNLDYAHAPKTDKRYLQMYTSFGCNGVCNFCTNPYINKSNWRPRPTEQIVKEIQQWYDRGVVEFHFEDLNPSPTQQRIMDICKGIIASGMRPVIKIASGTRIENLNEDAFTAMYLAGFRYLSFSPESGSKWVLQLMNKSFDHEHAIRMIKFLEGKMITQACFVLGYPGETDNDLESTQKYAFELAKAGVDEFAFFNFMPSIGSTASEGFNGVSTDVMTFSSDWRIFNKLLKALRIKWVIL